MGRRGGIIWFPVDADKSPGELISWVFAMKPGEPRIELVPATEKDGRLIWAWRNDPAARRNSLNPGKISLGHSLRWLKGKLSDDRCLILVARSAGKPVGQLRLDLVRPGTAQVSISVDPKSRGRGIGTLMLRAVPDRLSGRRLTRCLAVVKPDNVASVVAFVKAGFRFTAVARLAGSPAYRFEKRFP